MFNVLSKNSRRRVGSYKTLVFCWEYLEGAEKAGVQQLWGSKFVQNSWNILRLRNLPDLKYSGLHWLLTGQARPGCSIKYWRVDDECRPSEPCLWAGDWPGQYTLRHDVDLTHRGDDGHQGAVAVQPGLLADAELDQPLQGGARHEAVDEVGLGGKSETRREFSEWR